MSQPFNPATLPLHGLRLIEASAGTGKTFSLAGLYLRLIVEQGARVRDILVMTFTRAAAHELRERIRARLADAARIAHAPEWADPDNAEHRFTLEILENRNEGRAALARRLGNAAARVDEAAIVTIHGFAQRAASENAFESALAFDRGEAIDDPAVFREAAADYWREQVFGADCAADALALWSSPDALYQTIKPVLDRPHLRLAGIDHNRLAELRTALAATWPGTAQPLAEATSSAFTADALVKDKGLYKALVKEDDIRASIRAADAQIRGAIADGSVPVLPKWFALLADPEAQFKTRPQCCLAYAEPLANLPALPLLAELQPLTRLIAIDDAVAAICGRAAERKIARRQYSYDDLIQALYRALTAADTGDPLADALQARWPYALVDEFQDTDPLQYASLRRIYLDRPRAQGALLLIGDPKQAIYGFRGGDIYAYLAAARAAGNARYTLTTNFRSTGAALEAIEALYRLPQTNPFVVPDIDFPSVAAGRTAGDKRLVAADGELAALTFWRLQGGEKVLKNGKRKNPSKDDDKARLIEQTIAGIGRLLDGESAQWQHADGSKTPIAARDIAVLVNDRRQATALQTALARRGIMAVCQHRDSVFGSGEAADLRVILRAMAAPDDATAVRAAQPTALIGKRLGELIALADDDQAMQDAIARFHALHEAWTTGGVLSALEPLFMGGAPGLLALTDGERRMSNYLQLGELLANAESQCFGMSNLVRWLDQHIAATDDSSTGIDDQSQLRLESDANLVRISTVHAAKGLQYPIVFLPFAPWLGAPNSKHPRSKPPLHFHDRDANAWIDLVGDDEANREQAIVEARSEALRLLYVALTRAEQALFVAWRDPDDYDRAAALDDLLHRDGADQDPLATLAHDHPHAIAVETVDTTQPPGTTEYRPPLDPESLTEARRDLPAPRPRWSTYSFSRLAHAAPGTKHAALPEPGAEDEPGDMTYTPPITSSLSNLPPLDHRLSGTRFGTAVHDILETSVANPARPPWPIPGTPPTEQQQAFIAKTLRQYGLVGKDNADPCISDTANLIARTLHSPLPEIGPLATLAPHRARTEMAFMLRLRGNRLGALVDALRGAGYLPAPLGGHPAQTLYGLMQGYIDLVAEADGRYYVLDYKTNRLGDTAAAYHPDALQRAIGAAHYDLQYLIYSVALHRHLRHCLGAGYDPAAHLGGVQYLFLRAMDGKTDRGVFTDRPDPALIEALDGLFDSEAAAA